VGIGDEEKLILFKRESRSPTGIEMNPSGVGIGLYISKILM
jgi:hypothetical protein